MGVQQYYRVGWDLNSPYRYRNDNLRVLGFSSYRAYVQSALWKSIRARVIERDGSRCQRCRHIAERPQVHHRAYDPATLRGDTIDALSCVCAGCHRKAEQPENFVRSSHDRLHEASAMLHHPKFRRRQKNRERTALRTAPVWADTGTWPSEPRPVYPAKRKRSEVR